jgi:hypothetical protein
LALLIGKVPHYLRRPKRDTSLLDDGVHFIHKEICREGRPHLASLSFKARLKAIYSAM